MRRTGARTATVVLVAGGLVAAGCGDGGGTDAASAASCEELVTRAGRVVRELVAELDETSAAELQLREAEDPFAVLTEPFDPFRERAEELGCDTAELRRLACEEYLGIRTTGPLTEELLAEVEEVCR